MATLDLHGLTREEALSEVDREVDHLFFQNEEYPQLKIVTGWGDVLRPLIREFLERHPLVKEIRVEGPIIHTTIEGIAN